MKAPSVPIVSGCNMDADEQYGISIQFFEKCLASKKETLKMLKFKYDGEPSYEVHDVEIEIATLKQALKGLDKNKEE